MKPAVAALLALFSMPLAMSAQTSAQKQDDRIQASASLPIAPPSNISGCPTSLRAQQVSSADRMQVRNDQPKSIGQRLHLTLANPDSKRIAGAAITVRGFTHREHIMDAVAHHDQRSFYAARTISVTFSPTTGKNVAADIVAPGMSAVQTIDLISLNYADGSTWQLAEIDSCRITPDPLMLISAVTATR